MRVPPFPTPRAVLSMTSAPRMPVRRCETTTTFSGPHSSMSASASVILLVLLAWWLLLASDGCYSSNVTP